MPQFHIDIDTIRGLDRITNRFGKEMTTYIIQQWFVDHQILPEKDVYMSDEFVRLDSGIVIKARVFRQPRNFS